MKPKLFFILLLIIYSEFNYACSPTVLEKDSKEYKEQITKYKKNIVNRSKSILEVSVKDVTYIKSQAETFPLYLLKVHKGSGKPTQKTINFGGLQIMGCEVHPKLHQKYLLFIFKNNHQKLMTHDELKELNINIEWTWFHGHDNSVIYYPSNI